jgi:hypothetical protein
MGEEFQLRHVAVRNEHTELYARAVTVLGKIWKLLDMRWLTPAILAASALAEYGIYEERVSTKACCRPK